MKLMIDTDQIMTTALELAGLSEVPTDSGIWAPGTNIRKILFGVDIGTAELEIAKRLGYDLVIAHHPPEATVEAWREYLAHVDQMVAAGVPRGMAENAISGQVDIMQRRAQGRHSEHTVSWAKLIGMPYMNIHTPLDVIGRQRMESKIDQLLQKNPQATLADVVDALEQFGEVRNSATRPIVLCGDLSNLAGKVVISHGALEIPSYPILKAYYSYGVGTVVALYMRTPQLEQMRRDKPGAWIGVGHLAGDSLGINPFLNALEAKGLEITRISGVLRG
jgi:hypothetical protein